MKKWTLVADGLDMGRTAAEIEKIAPLLDALEAALRPLVATLPPDAEPALAFDAQPEERL